MYGPILSANGGFTSVNGENIFRGKWEKWPIKVWDERNKVLSSRVSGPDEAKIAHHVIARRNDEAIS